jgi:DNA repair protein RecO (recombination protein O)
MNERYQTKGFIFKKDDRLEADRLFSVFTEDFGRIEILGRAIRKIASKLRGGIEVFSLSKIEFIQGKNYKTLTDAILIKKFSNIANDPGKTEIANKIINVLSNLINGQEKDEQIWNLLAETFEKINNCSMSVSRCSLIYYYFLWDFLSVLGYLPETYKCAACRGELNSKDLYFSNKEGGAICKDCLDSYNNVQKINQDAVKILRIILKKDWKILSKLKIDDFSYDLFKKISDDYYRYLLSCHSFNFTGGGILRANLRESLKMI